MLKFSADVTRLSEKLGLVQGISERRATMPVLSHVLISASKEGLRFSATDLETTMITWCDARISGEGSIAVPARKLYEVLKVLPHCEVEVEEIGNHWVQLKTQSATFKIAGLPGEDFPAIPELSSESLFPINGSLIDDMISKTIFAVSPDELRRNLSGICFEKTGKQSLRLVATDGHRLSFIEKNIESDVKLSRSVVVPKKGISELRKMVKLSESIRIGCGKNFFMAEGDGIVLIVRLIDAEFPDYKQVIPEVTKSSLQVKRDDFLSALKRVSVISSEKTRSVKLIIEDGKMTLISVYPEIGEAREDISVDFKGEALEVGFNARYLMDVLEAIGEESVYIGITDELSPAVIKPIGEEKYVSVIMPMRV